MPDADETPDDVSESPAWFGQALTRRAGSFAVRSHDTTLNVLAWNRHEVDKPALLLAHGFLAHAHWWDAMAPAFVDLFRVFAFDFSGMGDSTHREEYANESWSEDIVAVATALGPGRAHLVGHSFGGTRSLRAAALAPELFAQLVLVDSYLHFGATVPAKPGRWSNHTVQRRYPDRETALSRYRLIPEEPAPAFMLRHVAQHSVRANENGWSWKFDPRILAEGRFHEDARLLLQSLRIPLSIIRGASSATMRAEMVDEAVRIGPPPVQRVAIAGGAHHLPLTHPLELTSGLRGLLVAAAPETARI